MQIQIGQMVFLTSEKWASDQSQVIDEIFDQWKHKYGFFAFVEWVLPKWMKVNVSNVCWVRTTVESRLQG